MPLTNQIALVTGAGSGIGRCLAAELAAKGARLILVDRDEADLAETIAVHGLTDATVGAVIQDFADPGAAAAVARQARDLAAPRPITLLWNNAGTMVMGQVRRQEWADVEAMRAVNLDVPVRLTHLLLEQMIAAGGGRIAFTSSAAGLATPPGAAAYGMSKAGLVAFAEGLRAEVHRHGISVTTVCPGFVHSPFAHNIGYRDDRARARTTAVPRLIGNSPERVARVAVRAALRGRGQVVFGWDERFKRLLKGLSPRLYGLLNRGVARLLLDG